MNAVELLKKQHREVDALVERFEKARRDDEKEAIFLELAARLVAHDAIEREIFYPACERALGKIEPLMEGIAEHGLIEFSIFRADKARGKHSFDYLVRVLAEMVKHHVEEEEAEVLPQIEDAMDESRLARLGERLQERFDASMSTTFRTPLRRNLEQVIGGRTKTTPPKRAAARATGRKRPMRGGKRPTVRAKKKEAR
ncbi:MAG TPA: hemerythrin domain-containing protein [Labilithrix sp.]|nr:hemerythrin domain-containing protein [Labilithrix sp.]